MTNPKVCMCDEMPGLHNYGNECSELNEYIPNAEDIKFQKICKHVDGEDEEGSSFIIEGVCSGCGSIVDAKEAAKWSKK